MEENTNEKPSYSLSRRDIYTKAYNDCMKEMYARAQPPADINEYLRAIKAGEITDDTRPYIYERHYLSSKEAKYIIEKYVSAYRMENEWASSCDILLSDLKEGCSKDKWIPEQVDEDGYRHPGYRGYEKVEPLVTQLKAILGDEQKAEEINKLVLDFIEDRKGFYRFDREESAFNQDILLGACPTSNKTTVEEYWASQGKPVTIVDRHPDYLWLQEEGYDDEEIAEEIAMRENMDLEDNETNENETDEEE